MNCKNWHVSIVSPPLIEPVTLDEVLEHCHANPGVEDDWFQRQIVAARQEAEIRQRRAYIEQTILLTIDNWPDMPILLPRSPVISVDSVKVYDLDNVETVVDVADFYIDYDTNPVRMDFNNGETWPGVSLRNLSPIHIQYTAGYGSLRSDVPDYVKGAILIYIDHMNNNRGGEVPKVPKAFYDCLDKQRIYL